MIDYFHGGGGAMWPLLLVLLAVLFLAGHAALLIGRGEADRAEVEGKLRAVLFWGAMSLVMGLLGTSVGLVQMATAIARAERVMATTILGGVGVALITSVFGLLIFLVASVLWFSLRQWHLRAAVRSPVVA